MGRPPLRRGPFGAGAPGATRSCARARRGLHPPSLAARSGAEPGRSAGQAPGAAGRLVDAPALRVRTAFRVSRGAPRVFLLRAVMAGAPPSAELRRSGAAQAPGYRIPPGRLGRQTMTRTAPLLGRRALAPRASRG